MSKEARSEEASSLLTRCVDCDVPLVGEYCHACGQRRHGRLTAEGFLHDVRRRVFRIDGALVKTLWQMLRDPGVLVRGYIAGRRRAYLDPLQFFVASVFVQVMVAAAIQALAPVVHHLSALNWLGRLGGTVAVKILIIFWMAGVWRLLFRTGPYNLAEIFVFTTYAFATTNLLWALLPIIDLIVPYPIGADEVRVGYILVGIEMLYLTYAVKSFSLLPLWRIAPQVIVVLAVGYGVLTTLLGVEHALFTLPLMPGSWR